MAESVCKDSEIRIENVALKVDLVLFELDEIDVILRMNFLTKYHAILDCFNKEVVLKEPEWFEVKFIGNKKVELANIISVFKAKKLIKKRAYHLYCSNSRHPSNKKGTKQCPNNL